MPKSISFPKHAAIRAQEREFPKEVALFVARFGDVRKPARAGRRAVFISQHLADTLANQGFNNVFLNEALRCCVVIDGKTIVTVHNDAEMDRSFLN